MRDRQLMMLEWLSEAKLDRKQPGPLYVNLAAVEARNHSEDALILVSCYMAHMQCCLEGRSEWLSE